MQWYFFFMYKKRCSASTARKSFDCSAYAVQVQIYPSRLHHELFHAVIHGTLIVLKFRLRRIYSNTRSSDPVSRFRFAANTNARTHDNAEPFEIKSFFFSKTTGYSVGLLGGGKLKMTKWESQLGLQFFPRSGHVVYTCNDIKKLGK